MVPAYAQDKYFVKCAPHIFSVEGGYANDPKDPGGPTMRGIAWNFNQGLLKELGYRRETMATLTREDAMEIYYRKYWLGAHCQKLDDVRLQLIHFDAAVNQGVGASLGFLGKLPKNPRYFKGRGENEHFFLTATFAYFVIRMLDYTFYRQWARYGMGWIRRIGHIGKVIVQWSMAGEHRL